MSTMSASEARKNLFPLLGQVNADHDVVRITSKAGNGVLISIIIRFIPNRHCSRFHDSIHKTLESQLGRYNRFFQGVRRMGRKSYTLVVSNMAVDKGMGSHRGLVW